MDSSFPLFPLEFYYCQAGQVDGGGKLYFDDTWDKDLWMNLAESKSKDSAMLDQSVAIRVHQDSFLTI